jgi:hypothetical protein
MKIAIIGAGNVGSTLGRAIAQAGHEVCYAVRNVDDAKHEPLRDHARTASSREAVAWADVVLLTTPWAAAEAALADAGEFAGKPLLDATNPIGPGFRLTHGHTDSGAEQIARWAPSARVVKVFNTTGRENMERPRYADVRSLMLVAGDDDEACSIASTLAEQIGFEPLRVGNKLADARLLEPFAMVWIKLSMTHGREFALAVVRR